MKKFLLALALTLFAPGAWAQCTGVFPANTLCGNLSGSPAPPSAFSAATSIVGPGSSTVNDIVGWANTLGNQLKDMGGQTIGGNYTWSGTQAFNNNNTFTGNQTFSKGFMITPNNPWIDVTSGANGCAAAKGDGVTNDTAALNCVFTYVHNHAGVAGNPSAAMVYVPCGLYIVTSTITIFPNTTVWFANPTCAIFSTNNADITAVTIPASVSGNDFTTTYNMGLVCSSSTTAANSCMVIGANAVVNQYNVVIFGGKFGLDDGGTDGYTFGGYICGNNTTTGGCLQTSGGNWYFHLKLDGTAQYSWNIPAAQATGGHEMGCVLCDFSNTNVAININDTGAGTRAHVNVTAGVIGGPVTCTNAGSFYLSGAQIGTTSISASNCPTYISGNGIGGQFTVSGTGPFFCTAINVACPPSAANVQTTPGNPTGTANTTGLMAGLNVSFTPKSSTAAVVNINASASSSIATDGCKFTLRFGTGGAPANGAALTGTVIGNTNGQTVTSATANALVAVAITGLITGLTGGTAYWIDVGQAAVTGGTCSLFNPTVVAMEAR